MRRREFMAGLGGAVAWPNVLFAQSEKMPVIGFLDSGSRAGMTEPLGGFHRGLGEIGFTEGQNVAVEYRWASGHYGELPNLALELVQRPVTVIVATRGPAAARAAKTATTTIPIVFQSGGDPVKDGLVASLNRPGGNVTGATRLSTDLIPKRLSLLTELVPNLKEIALLVNPVSPQFDNQVKEMHGPTEALGLKLNVVKATNEHELESGFSALPRGGVSAVMVANDPVFIGGREQIVGLTLRLGVPTSFAERESVVAGGLMSYAASFSDSFRQVGVLTGRILKGAKPDDLPVQQPVKFELVINLKAAKTLGLTVPPMLLARADEVIE